jgi:hypothetical protein
VYGWARARSWWRGFAAEAVAAGRIYERGGSVRLRNRAREALPVRRVRGQCVTKQAEEWSRVEKKKPRV